MEPKLFSILYAPRYPFRRRREPRVFYRIVRRKRERQGGEKEGGGKREKVHEGAEGEKVDINGCRR